MSYPPPFGQPSGMPPRPPFGYGPPPGPPPGAFQPGPPMFQGMPPNMHPAPIRPGFSSPPALPSIPRPMMSQTGAPTIYKAPIRTITPEVQPTTIYVGNITDRYPDFTVAEILSACGPMLNWKRVKGHDFKLQGFGFCEFENPDGASRASRLLHEMLLGNDKKLVIKIDAKTQEKIDEWNKRKLVRSGKRLEDLDLSNLDIYLDEKTKAEDKCAMDKVAQIITQANIVADETDATKPSIGAELPKKLGGESAEDKNRIINKEIKHFRSDDQKSKSKSGDSVMSPSSEANVDKPKDDSAAVQIATAPPGIEQPQPQPIDEEEAAERRRAERRAREKAERYAEKLKAWESRERDKARYFSRIREKEADIKQKQERDARKLKQFLEDYDDFKDDPKYYRGTALSQRLKEREREIEADSRDRKREKEEMDDVRRKLKEQGCRNLEEEMEKLEQKSTAHLLPRLRGEGEENFASAVSTTAVKTEIQPSPHSDSNSASLDQHIQQLSSQFQGNHDGTENASRDDQEESHDGQVGDGNKSFVPARFQTVGVSDASAASPSRKRPSIAEEEAAAAASSLKLSLQNKTKRLAAFSDADDGEQQGPNTNRAMVRLGPLPIEEVLSEENKKERIQQLIKSIPSGKDELFAYNLDWGQVDKILIDKKIRPWIDKKVTEYIGEQEATLSEFLCQKVLARTTPDKLLEEIAVIFDDEAQTFIIKLWRLLIYETEARKLKINQF